MKRQVGEGVFILKFKTINVTHGENVTYSNNKLEFIDNRNNKTIPERRCVYCISIVNSIVCMYCYALAMLSPNLSGLV